MYKYIYTHNCIHLERKKASLMSARMTSRKLYTLLESTHPHF